MGKRKSPKAEFNFSVAMLVLLARQKKVFLTRDLIDLILYNITAPVLVVFDALINAFEALPTDDQLLGNQTLATTIKDGEADLLRDIIRDIMVRAENKWGVDTPQYNKFGTEGLSAMTDAELSLCGKNVSVVATGYLPDLAPLGLTAGIITSLDGRVDSFDLALTDLALAVGNREIGTERRVIKANELYAQMRFLCNFGKQRYWNNNEAKYNDYLMPDEGGIIPVPEPEPIPEPEPVV